jgi:hypothetical protein
MPLRATLQGHDPHGKRGSITRMSRPTALRRVAQNPHETLAHLALGFCDVSRERRKIRQVGGGAMRISSRLGKGTTVVVRLPIDAVTPQRVDIKNVAA